MRCIGTGGPELGHQAGREADVLAHLTQDRPQAVLDQAVRQGGVAPQVPNELVQIG